MEDKISIEKNLKELLKDFQWNFKGIIDTNGNIHPIPKIPQVISGIFEAVSQYKIEKFAKSEYKCSVIHGGPREYPNLSLKGGKIGKQPIAIDVKTARKKNKELEGRASLGSCAGYFLCPEKKKSGCTLPYGDFSEHLIILFLYTWNPEADSLKMVSNIELIVHPKWKIASRSTATGDTAAIGSIKDIQELRNGNGLFRSEKQFETYWREKGRVHKR